MNAPAASILVVDDEPDLRTLYELTLLREGYRVTLNTDNRLMSHTTMTDEFRVAVEHYGCTLEDLERVTVNAMNAAFFPYAERHRIIDERILLRLLCGLRGAERLHVAYGHRRVWLA